MSNDAVTPLNWFARDLLARAYGWTPVTIICPPPHALLLGGVDPVSETPFDVAAHEQRGAAREPTLIVSFGDPVQIEWIRSTRRRWPSDAVEWFAAEIHDHPTCAAAFRDLALEAVKAMELHRRMHRERTCIFVHCHMGISRSASVAALYLMRNSDMTLRSALEFLRWCRPCVYPNFGFLCELVALEGSVDGKNPERPQKG